MTHRDDIAAKEKVTRSETVREIIDDLIVRRAAGETISDESLIEAHSELMPELADGLRNLRMVECAEQDAKAVSQGLHIRCPHCQNPVELVDDESLSDVVCHSCGSHFSLVDDSPRTYQASSQQTIGHFQLLDKVGVGAYGSVWSARDTELDRTVAVKIPRKGQLSPEDGELFIREARAAAQLKHPNIVSVLEVGRHEDRIYIVTEFVQGLDLADWLTDQQATPREAAELCSTMADALQHAHDHGVIHRDLKPSNIMLDAAGEPHLMDFGLAKRESGEMTMTVEGKLLGTPAYMPPEQARGSAHDADARSDIYSLGVILFELLTGERPFRGSTRMLLHQVMVDDAPSPRKLNSRLPKDLETICLKCLEKDPERRYQTAAELREDLRRFLSGEPVQARPITKVSRAWRWCKRKPVVAALGLTVAGLLVFLAIAGPIVAARQAALRAAADREAQRANIAASEAQVARNRAEEQSERRRQLLYSSDMRTAQNDWLAGDMDGVLNLLERHYPQADQEDLRGFEWYHLWRNCQRNVMAPTLDAGGWVRDILVSPDGQTITTASSLDHSSQTYCSVKQWNTFTRVKIHERSFPLKGIGVQKLSPDGKLVAIGHLNGKVTLMDLTTGELRELSGLANEVLSLAFSPDGNVLAAGDEQGSIKMWDASGLELAPIEPHNDDVYCVAFSPDGKILASGSRGVDRMAKLSDVETGKVRMKMDHALYGSVWSTAFSPDGKLLATGTSGGIHGDFSVITWDVETGALIHKRSVDSFVTAVTFSPNGESLASASGDGRVRLWDVHSGDLKETLNGNFLFTRAITFFPDGTILACPGVLDDARLWQLDVSVGVSVLAGHDDNVTSLSFSPDGRALASAGDTKVILWDVAKGIEKFRLEGHDAGVSSVEFSPTGETLASAGLDNTVKIWDVVDKTLLATLPHKSGVRMVAYSPNGQLLASGGYDGTVTFWDLASREQVSILDAHDGYAISSLVFSHDGKTLTTSCFEVFAHVDDRNVKLWDVESLQLKETIPGGSGVQSLAYSADGQLLAHASQTIRLRNVVQSEDALSIPNTVNSIRGLVFSRNGRTLISSGDGFDVKFWDTTSGDLRFKLAAHRDAVYSMALSPDGKTLATGSADDNVKLWRAATDEEVELMRRRWLETRR